MTIAALAEASVPAAKAGAEPAAVRDALMGAFAASCVLDVHGQRMLDRTDDPGLRSALNAKDLRIATELARACGAALSLAAGTGQLLNALSAYGGADEHHSTLVRVSERLAAVALNGGAR
jgi:2-hydroxy-3-oxopropionate reductase